MRSFLRNNPIPLLVLFNLGVGLFAFFVLQEPEWAHLIWFIALIGGGAPIAYHTLKGMFQGEFASDVVAMLAIVTAVILNEAFAGAVVVLMQSGGEALERYGLRKASHSLMELLQRAPRKARRKRNGTFEEIDVGQVAVGDTLIIRPGELIPVDGTILQGTLQVDESSVTGEPFVQEKRAGDRLLSGCIVANGAAEMCADRVSEESQYAKIVQLVKKAQEEKAPIQRLADRYAIFFTPLTLCMALVGYLLTKNPVTILAVLVVATPCPLILATPLAVICGINRAAKEGIIIKGGAPIEQIALAKAALFDKTGTLTYGAPVVQEVFVAPGIEPAEVLYSAASLEQLSTHPIAKGVVAHARKQFSRLALPKNFEEVAGLGTKGDVEGHQVAVGSLTLIKRYATRESLAKIVRGDLSDQPQIWVARDGICIGGLILQDSIREGASQMIQELRQLGVRRIALVTGDRLQTAEAIARQVGIETFRAELLPEEKVEETKRFKKEGEPLLMVGDGINDAPALASATVGIAMGAHGTAISVEAADIVLLVDDLSKIPEAMRIGKRMLRIAKQSIFIGIGLSFALMVIASFGYIDPPVGALLQEIIDVAVILNALRVL